MSLESLAAGLENETDTFFETGKDNFACAGLCLARNEQTGNERNCNVFLWTDDTNCVTGFMSLQFGLDNFQGSHVAGDQTVFFDSVLWEGY